MANFTEKNPENSAHLRGLNCKKIIMIIIISIPKRHIQAKM